MQQLTLSRALGKGIRNANPTDVKNIQTRLQAIKERGQPLYKGKIDGKDGPKTEGGICAFQKKERLPITGCMKPGDRTVQRLKSRTPTQANAAVQNVMATASTDTSSGQAKTRQIVQATCKEVCNTVPIPKAEADALVKIIEKIGSDGVPVKLESVSLTQDGRFKVTLKPEQTGSINATIAKGVKDAQAALVVMAFKNDPTWSATPGSSLNFQTRKSFSVLKNPKKADAKDLKTLGITKTHPHTVASQCSHALARCLRDNDRVGLRELFDHVFSTPPATAKTLYAALDNSTMTDAAPAFPRPKFDDVWNNFHKRPDYRPDLKHISEIIGGRVLDNALSTQAQPIRKPAGSLIGTWVNFCAIRLSYALNQSGARIPFINGNVSSSGLAQNGGAKPWHFRLLTDLVPFLEREWGKPDIDVSMARGAFKGQEIQGEKGLLILDVDWSDATGHGTFWDGKKTVEYPKVEDDYFKLTVRVRLWKLP